MKKGIIFDFDGVIVDSLEIKSDVFVNLYRHYGSKIQQKVRKHHLANGGLSRYEKFKHYHYKFLGVELNEKEIEEMSIQFSNQVIDKVINCNYIPGVLDYIKNKSKYYNLFLSTGTPTIEIKEILKRMKLSRFFLEVHGSPKDKIYHIRKIIESYSYKPEDLIFYGDSKSDFILINNKHNVNIMKNKNIKKINNFLGLE